MLVRCLFIHTTRHSRHRLRDKISNRKLSSIHRPSYLFACRYLHWWFGWMIWLSGFSVWVGQNLLRKDPEDWARAQSSAWKREASIEIWNWRPSAEPRNPSYVPPGRNLIEHYFRISNPHRSLNTVLSKHVNAIQEILPFNHINIVSTGYYARQDFRAEWRNVQEVYPANR